MAASIIPPRIVILGRTLGSATRIRIYIIYTSCYPSKDVPGANSTYHQSYDHETLHLIFHLRSLRRQRTR